MSLMNLTRRSTAFVPFLVILVGVLALGSCSQYDPWRSVDNDDGEVFQSSQAPVHLPSSEVFAYSESQDRSQQLVFEANHLVVSQTVDTSILHPERDPARANTDQVSTPYDPIMKDSFANIVAQERILQDVSSFTTSPPVSPPSTQPAASDAGKPTEDLFHPLFTPAGWDFFQNFDSESIIVNQSPTTATSAPTDTQSPIWPAKAPSIKATNSTDVTGNETGPTLAACDSSSVSADEDSPCSNTTTTPIPAKRLHATTTSSELPSTAPTTRTSKFEKLFINAGGDAVRDIFANDWMPDAFHSGGQAFSDTSTETPIDGTKNGRLYQTQRVGTFDYEIPVPEGNYELILHFADLDENATEGANVFDIVAEKRSIFPMVDIVALIGTPRKALTLETAIVIVDGHLSLNFRSVNGLPTLSAIEIDLVGDHLAHAVAGGPYEVVDIDSDGFAHIHVDGSLSHTHGIGLDLISWQWYEHGALVGIGERATLSLPVGKHDIVLKVLDNGGNQHSEAITITVRPSGHPVISSLSPSSGDIVGGTLTVIDGFGFHFPIEETTVRFGGRNISSNEVQILNSTQIQITSVPPSEFGMPVPVSVITPTGESNTEWYTYINDVPIDWRSRLLLEIPRPTTLAFGPDQKLYIGTADGKLLKVTLSNNFDDVLSTVESVVVNENVKCLPSNCRSILGIAFDPLDLSADPSVYVSHSKIFHGSRYSSSGDAVNGKVSRLSGPNLDIIEHIITGLPVSDHDHAVNGLEFGDNGELYVLVGGNTNAGIPGSMSGSKLQKEGVFSAAALVAYISRDDFDGNLRYDQLDDGNLIGGHGVEVFSSGLRNPYDLVLHSMNGHIYATDNGPNSGYGKASGSCDEGVDDVDEEDKLNLLIEGGYYGHANRKRGEQDSNQCVWRGPNEPSSTTYEAPLAILPASSDGIIEFQSNHFNGQLRGNLIISKYKDGRAVVREANPPFLMSNDGGLDIAQGPTGQLYVAKYKNGKIRFLVAQEPSTTELTLKSVFPRRGHVGGGTLLHVFGENLDKHGIPSIFVGNKSCRLVSLGESKATCIIPDGNGRENVTISAGNQTSVLIAGYRFITGVDVVSDAPSRVPSNEPSTARPSKPMDANPIAPFKPFSFRLNAGGGYFRDQQGRLWEPDAFHNFFLGPSTIALTEQAIAGTEDDPLFQSARYFQRNRLGPYKYEVPVPTQGFYRVNLGFAEIVDRRDDIGDRKANIRIENLQAVSELDIVEEAGGAFIAFVSSHRSLVLDGLLTLEFAPVKFNPMINTIEIILEDTDLSGVDLSTSVPSTTPSVSPTVFETSPPSLTAQPSSKPMQAIVRINAGGKEFVDSNGSIWVADSFYHGASSKAKTKHVIRNTDNISLFQTARFFRRNRRGPFFYDIPVPSDGNYTVTLGFAEIVDWRTKSGDRRMIISLEDEMVLDKFDIVEAAGAGYTATFATMTVRVSDGYLTIMFIPFKFNPTVSTIEVFISDT